MPESGQPSGTQGSDQTQGQGTGSNNSGGTRPHLEGVVGSVEQVLGDIATTGALDGDNKGK